jgi:hypothetical protein
MKFEQGTFHDYESLFQWLRKYSSLVRSQELEVNETTPKWHNCLMNEMYIHSFHDLNPRASASRVALLAISLLEETDLHKFQEKLNNHSYFETRNQCFLRGYCNFIELVIMHELPLEFLQASLEKLQSATTLQSSYHSSLEFYLFSKCEKRFDVFQYLLRDYNVKKDENASAEAALGYLEKSPLHEAVFYNLGTPAQILQLLKYDSIPMKKAKVTSHDLTIYHRIRRTSFCEIGTAYELASKRSLERFRLLKDVAILLSLCSARIIPRIGNNSLLRILKTDCLSRLRRMLYCVKFDQNEEEENLR